MPGNTSLLQAVQEGNKEETMRLLLLKSDPDQADTVYQWTPLHIACREGRLEIIKLLLAHKAHLDARDSLGQTPLHRAAHWGHVEIVRYLISAGADFTALDHLLQTPEELARIQGKQEAAEVIRGSVKALQRNALSHYTPKQQQKMKEQISLKAQEDQRRKEELMLIEKRNKKATKEKDEARRQDGKLREKKADLTHELEILKSRYSPSSPEGPKVLARIEKLEKKLEKVDGDLFSLSKQLIKRANSNDRGDAWIKFLSADL